ncbi:MAG TPA: hypothetical protein VLR94_03580, partial [Acidobacteriota bacterium]|nr:hypothetical protein [Acidobacteriota bacterium]
MDLFAGPPSLDAGRSEPRIEIASAAGDYDEAWGVAKKVLKLVLDGAAFDQILIVARSAGAELAPLLHVLRENRVPFRVMGGTVLASSPYTKFATLVLEARESGLAPAILMELLSSPFLPRIRGNDFRRLADLMENLIIRSWEDWDRLDPLLQEGSLPQFYEFLEDRDPVTLQSLREMVQRIQELKSNLLQIPDRAPLPVFASTLKQTLEALAPEEGESTPLMEMLSRVAGYRDLDSPELSLAGFTDVFRMYVQDTAREEIAGEGVLIADIMQARGTIADFTFVMGLNRDVFPRRTQEDPFLPDDTRRILREVTGAGPFEKRPRNLLPLKEGTDEELLLFALALRTARKALYLSFRRADEAGRKAAISNYLDELLRLLTGKTSENNERIAAIPRHHASKFTSGVLPTLTECAALPALCSPEEWLRHCGLSERHADRIRDFGSRLNHTLPDASRALDGIIEDPAAFWMQQQPQKPEITLSYSRLKQYLQCPFQFLARNLLQLQESPRDAGDEDHDL